MQLSLLLGDGGEGVSVSYGELHTGGLSEHGGGMGLRLLLRSRAPQIISVFYGHTLLWEVAPPFSLTGDSFTSLTLAYGVAAHGGFTRSGSVGLSLLINNEALLSYCYLLLTIYC